MINLTGLLSKTSHSQYRLLTMDGEFLIKGNLLLHDGFHSNLDLSTYVVSQIETTQVVSSGTFNSRKITSTKNGIAVHSDCVCGDCPDDCDCKGDGDCTNPDD